MATTAELLTKALEQLAELGEENVNEALLEAIAAKVPKTSLDASLVSGSDDKELDYIVNNFMAKKLEETDKEVGRAKLDAVVAKLNELPSKGRKQRAVVYYLLVLEYGKESVYL